MSGLDMGEQNTPASSPISAGTSNTPCLTPKFNMAMEPQEEAEFLGLPYLLHLSLPRLWKECEIQEAR